MKESDFIRPRVPFKQTSDCESFDRSLTQHIGEILDENRAKIIPSENIERYSHGKSWRSHASYKPDEVSEVETHEHGSEVKISDIVDGNLNIIPKLISEMSRNMHASMMRMLFRKLDETCNATGNVVSRKGDQTNADAFIEMLKTIEFGVDRNGNPSLPQFHATPEAVDAMLKDIKSKGPEFEAEVERIKSEKISAALEREKERRGKFLTYPAV